MNSILYHQKIKENRNGQRVYLGEDAYPYADKDFIIVADGLGGRGGFPHRNFKKDILDKERFYDILFDDAFGKPVSEEFKEFVLKSFNELFETSEYYFDQLDTIKCSGYFASRIVTAITLYELKYEPFFDKATLFEQIRNASDEERDEVVQKIGDELARRILTRLVIVASNANLELEMKMAGAYLLPTTLTVAITDEKEDSVDVIYLWAGDSRGYVWDKDGLGQITEDHEKDEAMTNIITMTSPFRIEGRFVTVNKPCILFNASDGCYKCPVFASPIDLECVFISAINTNDTLDGAMSSLSPIFNQIGRHDDSNTMALSTFGYESYEAIKDAVKERLGYIESNVTAKLPDIFERDYTYELQRVNGKIDSFVVGMKDKLIAQPSVMEFAKADMIEEKYPPYIKEVSRIENEREDSGDCEELYSLIRKWVVRHWIQYPELKKKSSAKDSFIDGINPFEEYKGYRRELDKIKERHQMAVCDVIEELPSAYEKLGELLEELKNMKNIYAKNASYSCEEMRKIVDFAESVIKRTSEETKEYNSVLGKNYELSEMYDKYDDQAIKEVIDQIISGELDLSYVNTRDIDLLKEAVEKYRELNKDTDTGSAIIDEIANKHLPAYWNYRGEYLCKKLWQENKELIPQEILECASRELEALEGEKEQLSRGLAIREEIYNEYYKTYIRLYRGSKI